MILLTYFRSSHEGFLVSAEGRMMKTSGQAGFEKFIARENNGIKAICGVTQLFINSLRYLLETKLYGLLHTSKVKGK